VIQLLLSNCFAISVMWIRRRKSAPQMGVFPHAIGIFPQSLRNIPYNYSGLTSTATGLLSAAFANTSSRTPSFKTAVVLSGSTSAGGLSSRQNWFERNNAVCRSHSSFGMRQSRRYVLSFGSRRSGAVLCGLDLLLTGQRGAAVITAPDAIDDSVVPDSISSLKESNVCASLEMT
jgi:hypothetical protein